MAFTFSVYPLRTPGVVLAARSDVEQALRQRDTDTVIALMLAKETGPPYIRDGFKTETELWEYKRDIAHIGHAHENAWAHIAKDVLAFHNNKGGIIFFWI